MRIDNYFKATSLEQAYNKLLEDDKNLIIGGGAWLKLTNKEITSCIDITKIGLNEIIETDQKIEIGAMTSLRQIEQNDTIKTLSNGILSEAISQIMGVGIRNIATIGGSVMGKYSFSDLITPLLVMGASLVFYKKGEITIDEFLQTKKMEKDILLKIVIPLKDQKGFFYKMQKTRLDFAVINVAITKGETIDIAVGARPSITARPVQAIAFLNQLKDITEEDILKASEMVVQELKFSTNAKASKEYRELITKVYTKRGLRKVVMS